MLKSLAANTATFMANSINRLIFFTITLLPTDLIRAENIRAKKYITQKFTDDININIIVIIIKQFYNNCGL